MSASARLPLKALFPPAPPTGRRGDPGVVVPGGVFQRLWGDRLILAGGPAAILLQVAHPLVGTGVVAHSTYATRPGHRLEETLQLVMAVAFGDTEQARAAVARVARRHTTVNGTLPADAGRYRAGTPYDATAPDLALWVYATLVRTALAVHERYRGPLDDAEREAYWQQSKPFVRLFGVPEDMIPAHWDDFQTYWAAAVDQLVVTPALAGVARDMLAPRLLPPVPGAGVLVRAVTADLLPPPARKAYALPLTPARRALVHATARLTRVLWPRTPRPLREFPHARRAQQRLAGTAGNGERRSYRRR